jgi:hypothetical protein
MAPTYRIERDRGSKEFPQQLAVLRERWPIAFPIKHEDVRPLAMGVAREVAAAMSWSLPYALGVLTRWKMSAVYCQAVLSHDHASVSTARRPKWSTRRRRSWLPNRWRSLRRGRLRRPLQLPW